MKMCSGYVGPKYCVPIHAKHGNKIEEIPSERMGLELKG